MCDALLAFHWNFLIPALAIFSPKMRSELLASVFHKILKVVEWEVENSISMKQKFKDFKRTDKWGLLG